MHLLMQLPHLLVQVYCSTVLHETSIASLRFAAIEIAIPLRMIYDISANRKAKRSKAERSEARRGEFHTTECYCLALLRRSLSVEESSTISIMMSREPSGSM